MPEGCGVVVAMEGAARLVIEDGERAAVEGGVDFGEQPLRAVGEFLAG